MRSPKQQLKASLKKLPDLLKADIPAGVRMGRNYAEEIEDQDVDSAMQEAKALVKTLVKGDPEKIEQAADTALDCLETLVDQINNARDEFELTYKRIDALCDEVDAVLRAARRLNGAKP